MRKMREAGILLPIASLPSADSIGSFGYESNRFVDFLKKAGQKVWQILPLTLPDSYNSPYASLSSYALNHYLIDRYNFIISFNKTHEIIMPTYLMDEEAKTINYKKVIKSKDQTFRMAFKEFKKYKPYQDLYKTFIEEEKDWLDDYALFMAIKVHLNKDLQDWPLDIRLREEASIKKYTKLLKNEIEYYKFLQFHAYKDYLETKEYANKNDVDIFGDLPFYSSYSSVEVWTNPKVFLLDENLHMTATSGTPPDYFSETGQNWMTPVYNKEYLKKTNFKFLIDKLKHLDKLYDRLRLDHFLGFDRYFIIPKGMEPKDGIYEEGFGREFLAELKKHNLKLRLYAEDLGNKRDEADKLLEEFEIPGMNVLQFSLDGNPNNPHLRKNHKKDSVTYTGTHDNETTEGFLKNLNDNGKKIIKEHFKMGYPGTMFFVIEALKSPSYLTIIPIQDYLEEDNAHRINTPGTTTNNWVYKLTRDQLTDKLAEKIFTMNKLANRLYTLVDIPDYLAKFI